jgi:hypothetical protein
MADVRRYAGYPQVGSNHTVDDSRDFAAGWVLPGVWETLYSILTNLTAENEAVLINTYLTNLNSLETAIVSAAANLDTQSAAVWVRNPNEVKDRERLFDSWRRRMCNFLGIAPGPSLQPNNTLSRC